MKKYIFLLLFPLFLLAKESVFTVAMPQDNMANPWRKAQVLEIQKEFSKHKNINFIFSDAKGDSSQQLFDAISFANQKVDLLIISPADVALAKPILEDIYNKGIPVVLLTRKIESDRYTAFISPDDEKIAYEAARTIATKNSKAKILMLKGLTTASTAKKRESGFLKALEKYPNLTLVATKTANYSTTDAILAVDEIIAQNTNFDTIYAHSDSMAEGARIALRKNGLDLQKILIVGIDYIKEAKNAILKGEQFATFTYPTCAKEGVQIALKILNKEAFKKDTFIPSIKVTKENVEKIPTIF